MKIIFLNCKNEKLKEMEVKDNFMMDCLFLDGKTIEAYKNISDRLSKKKNEKVIVVKFICGDKILLKVRDYFFGEGREFKVVRIIKHVCNTERASIIKPKNCVNFFKNKLYVCNNN
jgi:hypothetical protein